MAQNYYQILGVGRKATAEEIQLAYRARVTEVYPGVNRGEAEANERMKEINRAYETLRSADKRREYDEISMPGAAKPTGTTKQPSSSQPAGQGGGVQGTSSGSFADAFNMMRDQARTNATGTAGQSEPATASSNAGPVVEIWLTPREAVDGAEKRIKVNGKLIRLKIGIRR